MNRATSAVLLLLGAWVGPAAGQQVPAEATDVVTDEISVTVVEIPVQVLAHKKPVRGLEAADFEVYDRGVLQEIVSFEVLDLSEPAPDGSGAGANGTAGDPERARHLLLLFDIDFTDWRELPRAILGVRELIADQLHGTDRVAVGFYSSVYGIQMLTEFVTDRAATTLAVDVIAGMVSYDPSTAGTKLAELAARTGLRFEGEEVGDDVWLEVGRRWTLSAQQPAGESPHQLIAAFEADDAALNNPAYSAPELDPVIADATSITDLYDESIMRQVRELGLELGSLARQYADLPDPKHVIFLSQGFPSRFLDNRDHTTRVLFRLDDALRAFLETGWVMQAIDVRGIPGVEESVFDGNSLFYLAEHTGGWLYENFNRIGVATERLLQRSTVTYLLAIQPEVKADGSFHELEVRLKGDARGKVFHRPAYRAPRFGDQLAKLDSRRDIAELILADTLLEDFEIEVMTLPRPAAGGRTRVPVVIEIPGEVLLKNPFGDNAAVDVHAYALDADRVVQDLFVRRLNVDLVRQGKRLERGGLRLVGHLELGAGTSEIRVLVHNLSDDTASLSRLPVDIARQGEGHLVVLPPMFIDRSRDWVSLTLTPEEEPHEAAEVATLALVGDGYFPLLQPSFRSNRVQEVVVNFFLESEASPRLLVRVLSARGEELQTPKIRLVQRWEGEGGANGLLATVQGKGLAPGRYTLEVSVVDPVTGESATSSQRFRIVEPS